MASLRFFSKGKILYLIVSVDYKIETKTMLGLHSIQFDIVKIHRVFSYEVTTTSLLLYYYVTHHQY